MRIVLSGGGTAGHINPALALAEVLIERGHEIFFAGTPHGIEARLVKEAGIPFKPFEAAGFNRNHPASIVRAMRLITRSTKAAKAWFSDIEPDVVVGFGGYVCIPVGRAAEHSSIPLVIHEQNSVMGIANRFLSRKTRIVALTYPEAASVLPDACKSKAVVTGNPVRASVLTATREQGRTLLDVPDDDLLLLIFGGSLGARHINAAVCALKERLLAVAGLRIVHITGPKEYDAVVQRLSLSAEEAMRWQVMGYQDRMGETLAAADVVVSRAGATSLAEISALRIPALLVPFPFATADHQTTNARSYVEAGAASMVSDDQVEEPVFEEKLFALIEDAGKRESMREAACGFETRGAAGKLADVVIGAARRD